MFSDYKVSLFLRQLLMGKMVSGHLFFAKKFSMKEEDALIDPLNFHKYHLLREGLLEYPVS